MTIAALVLVRRRWPVGMLVASFGFRIVGSTEQDLVWTHVLKSLAAHFG